MKKVFQWMSALALMVMCTCAFVACSDDDDDNSGGSWTSSKNAKILGTWEISSVSSDDPDFDPYRPGPEMGQIISFKSDGTFTQGGESGTFKYNNETGAFSITSKHMSSKGTVRVSENGESMVGTIDVTSDGVTVTYTVKFVKIASGGDEGGDEGGDGGDTDWSQYVQDSRMVGTWTVATDGLDQSNQGKAITFNSNGTFSVGSKRGTYKTWTDTSNGENRIRFELYVEGTKVNEGKFVLVSDGNVLNGNYRQSAEGAEKKALVLKKPSYTYPTGDVQGRWIVKFKNTSYMQDGPEVGSVIVFDNGQMYVEGDAHYNGYGYSNNSLAIYFEEGPMTVDVVFSENRVTVVDGDWVLLSLEKL